MEQGDILESQDNTYARIRFLDDSEISMRPNTQFKIEQYSFDETKPANDRSVYSLIKGGLRSITGSLGKRNKERYQLNTPAATIGIRGTTYIVRYIPESDNSLRRAECTPTHSNADNAADNAASSDTDKAANSANDEDCSDLKPGLYVSVVDGAVVANNGGGSQIYTAGESGFASSFRQGPILIMVDPGVIFDMPSKRLGSVTCHS